MTMLFVICFIAADKASADSGLDMNNATQLKMGELKTVKVNATSDRYCKTFKIQTSGKDAYYNIEFINSTVDNSLWVEVYDASGVMLRSPNFNSYIHEKNNDYCKLNKNSTYYIMITQSGSGVPSGEYKLKVYDVVDETGDDSYHAKMFNFGNSVSGKLQASEDNDWYKITAVKSGTHEIVIKSPGAYSFRAVLYDMDVIEKDYFDVYSNEKNSFKVYLKAGQFAYVKISNYYVDIYEPRAYTIEAKNPPVKKPAKVKLKSVKSGKRSLTVKYNAAKLASSYQIALKKKGNSWKYYVTKKLSKKFTKLAKKRKYSVKVRGIRNYEGKNYYGKWSKTRTVKIK